MHAVRGAWVGQTFALAKGNDSGGKKSRVRLSKEERKTMVESFIKKYQNTNNGKFPSLNLTHKHVGGSFYLIREIVREIIQENRVLGPPKFTPDEQDADEFFEQYPIGSISMESRVHVVSSNGHQVITNPILSDHYQNANESQGLKSDEQYQEPELSRLGDGISVDGSTHTSEQESVELLYSKLPVVKGLEGEGSVRKELVTSEFKTKLPPITADVTVDTFPLRPVTDTFSGDEDSDKSRDTSGQLEEEEIEIIEVEAVNNDVKLNTLDDLKTSSNLVDEKYDINAESLMNEKADPSLDSLNHSATEHRSMLKVNGDTGDLEIKDFLLKEHTSAPNDIEIGNGTTGSSSQGQPVSEVPLNKGAGSRPINQKTNPTLDRISLESWDAASDRSNGPETNSLMGFIKACVTAFVKFWSE